MLTVKQIQNDFYESVLNCKKTAILKQIRHNNILPEFRFNVYRNTIFQNLRHALELTFPTIWKLVGKECADALALTFVQNKVNLPKTNCLDDWGGKFPKFLQDIKTVSHLVYLKDIAQIDWFKHLSYCSSNDQSIDPIKLQKKLNGHHPEKLRLRFNPTVFLYSSSYFLKDIFDLIENPTKNESINLQSVHSYVVISRQHNQVHTHWVSEEMFHFFNQIKKRFTLMQSYEYTLQKYPNFNLTTVLQFMFKNELITLKPPNRLDLQCPQPFLP